MRQGQVVIKRVQTDLNQYHANAWGFIDQLEKARARPQIWENSRWVTVQISKEISFLPEQQ